MMKGKLTAILMAVALPLGVTSALSPYGSSRSGGAEAGYAAEAIQKAEQSRSYWRQLDTDRDSAISRKEAVKVPDLLAHWKYLDTDRNGRLDPSEFTAYETN